MSVCPQLCNTSCQLTKSSSTNRFKLPHPFHLDLTLALKVHEFCYYSIVLQDIRQRPSGPECIVIARLFLLRVNPL